MTLFFLSVTMRLRLPMMHGEGCLKNAKKKRQKMRFLYIVMLMFPILTTSGCSTIPKENIEKQAVETMYNDGLDLMEKKSFTKAIQKFEDLEQHYPYSAWATRAQMMVVYSHYRGENYDEAILAADRFINMHPGHENIDYMLYIKGMSFYERIKDVKRDQENTMEALHALEELRRRFPESEYARDARLKISLCLDHLAGQEMVIGRFYFDKKQYMSAINRYQYVVENYQTTSQTPEALFRLVEAYVALGLNQEAQISAAVLGHNFPNSKWYKLAYDLLKDEDLQPSAVGYEQSMLKKLFTGWLE